MQDSRTAPRWDGVGEGQHVDEPARMLGGRRRRGQVRRRGDGVQLQALTGGLDKPPKRFVRGVSKTALVGGDNGLGGARPLCQLGLGQALPTANRLQELCRNHPKQYIRLSMSTGPRGWGVVITPQGQWRAHAIVMAAAGAWWGVTPGTPSACDAEDGPRGTRYRKERFVPDGPERNSSIGAAIEATGSSKQAWSSLRPVATARAGRLRIPVDLTGIGR